MKEKFKSVKIGFWPALIASLCCLGPLFLVILGISTISTAIGIGYYKPYFLALGILFFVASLVYYLKQNKALICKGCNSAQEEKHRLTSIVFLAIIVLGTVYGLIVYFIVPQLAPIIYQRENPSKILSSIGSSSTSDLKRVNLKIEGMTCAGCAIGIENVLKNLPGISEARVEYPQGMGSVTYDPQQITLEKIIESIKPYEVIVAKDSNLEK